MRKINTPPKICTSCKKIYTRIRGSIKYWENSKFCSYKCMGISKLGKSPMQGKHHSPEIREKIRKLAIGRPNIKIRGKNHHNWKGGKTPINEQIRHSIEYKQWRTGVFERDNYTCQDCGIRNKAGLGKAIILQADHIKPFAYFPELRFNLDNGRTLCLNCHKLTNTWGYNYKPNKIINETITNTQDPQ